MINPAPTAGTSGALALCSTGTPTDLVGSLGGTPGTGTWTAPGGGAFGGTFDPASDPPGTYTYTVTGTAPCPNATATDSVTINPAPTAGTSGALALCSSGTPTDLVGSLGGTPGTGTWTAPGGGAFGGTFDPASDAPGVYTYTVTGTAPCPNATATVSVTINPAPTAGTGGALALCSSGT